MRIWNIPVNLLCDRHLLAEHRETHMLRAYVPRPRHKGMILGMMAKSILQPYDLKVRHDTLARELKARGFDHGTDMRSYQTEEDYGDGFVCPLVTAVELVRRCLSCRDRISTAVIWSIAQNLDHDCLTDARCQLRVSRDHAARPWIPAKSIADKPLS